MVAGASGDASRTTPPAVLQGDAGAPGAAEHLRHASQGYSSWGAQEDGALDGHDYLYELGRQSASMNIDMGQNRKMVDRLFTGGYLGQLSDIASGELRYNELRTLKHLDGEYHVPAEFLDRFALHMAKNYLTDKLGGEIPLCLGVWGKKGCGKSFMVELCCKAMGVEPIIMSAGELEDEWAGNPGKLIRERYRAAAMVIKNQGKMSCLIINDLDAGVGRFHDTQTTVNNQMVSGTLMNLCDDPNQVSVGQEWREEDQVPRVPIIITANDLSTLYAPLLRDGRMEKFYWEPSYSDLHRMIHTIFQDDGYTDQDIAALMEAHPEQPLDFYGALRARMYDEGILKWMQHDVGEERTQAVIRDLARPFRYLAPLVIGVEVPAFTGEGLDMSITRLLLCAGELEQEQQHVKDHQLAQEYMRWQELPELVPQKNRRELTHEELQAAASARADLAAMQKKREAEWAAQAEAGRAARVIREAEEAEQLRLFPPPPPPPEPAPSPWRVVSPVVAAEQLIRREGWLLLDVRSARDFGKECATAFGAKGIASVVVTGRPLAYELERVAGWLDQVRAAFPDRAASKLILLGGGPNELGPHEEHTEELLQQLLDDGYSHVALSVGGYENWMDYWTPAGRKRPPKGGYKTDMYSSGTMCVGSDLPVVGSIRLDRGSKR